MAGSPKEKLETEEVEGSEVSGEREIYLRDGKKLVVGESGTNQLVEVRIELTDAGPVLRMDAVKLELKAEQSIELESPKVAIRATEVKIESEDTVEVDAKGEVRVAGKMIYLN